MAEDQESPESHATRFSRTPEPKTVEELQHENDYLAGVISRLELRTLTDEELAYLRNRKEQDDRSAWVIKTLRSHAPWIISFFGAVGTFIYWLLTHTVTIGNKP